MAVVLMVTGNLPLKGQSVEEALKTINESSIKGQLGFLASDWMEGRDADTKGGFMAGDYIASMFQVFGIEPYGDMEYVFPQTGQWGLRPQTRQTYFQKFNIIKYKPSDKQSLSLINENGSGRLARSFNYGIDYSISGVESELEVESPIIFVGYGVKNDSLKYNDFARMNVKGKIIVRLDGFPGYHDSSSKMYKMMRLNNSFSQKEKWAREAGAVAVINLSSTPPREFGKPINLPFRYQSGDVESDVIPEKYYDKRAVLQSDSLNNTLPVIRLSPRLQKELLTLINVNLNNFELDAAINAKSAAKEINQVRINIKSGVESELVTVRNVLGIIEGEKKDEFVVVGAHYDHIGKYGGYIYNVADDNGSGTVGVMSIARAFKTIGKKPAKTIMFAAWTAEERGLLGSNYFVNNFKDIRQITANLNFDMIARNSVRDSVGNKCGLTYTKAYDGLEMISRKNVQDNALNLDIKYTASEQPTGGSDYAPFAAQDIPVIAFMAAMHPDYHKPTDELPKIEWGKMLNIIKLGFLNANDLANTELKTLRKK